MKKSRKRLSDRDPAEIITLRLRGESLKIADALVRRYHTTRADVLRAMIERLAIPALKKNKDALNRSTE